MVKKAYYICQFQTSGHSAYLASLSPEDWTYTSRERLLFATKEKALELIPLLSQKLDLESTPPWVGETDWDTDAEN